MNIIAASHQCYQALRIDESGVSAFSHLAISVLLDLVGKWLSITFILVINTVECLYIVSIIDD